MQEENLSSKLSKLREVIGALGKVGVAFSAGVDSTLVLKIASDELGQNAVAFTAIGAIHPKHEISSAREIAGKLGVKLVEITNLIDQDSRFAMNPPDRCYLCKKSLMNGLKLKAAELGIENIVEGSNLDDFKDFRPGKKAIAELGIISPLVQAGFTKADIRNASKQLGLSTWDRPSLACLASRFPYNTKIDRERLGMVEQAEAALFAEGFKQLRVRYHDSVARIEVPSEDLPKLMADDVRNRVVDKIKAQGFSYVSVDLDGYRTGSMNENLDEQE